MVLKNYVELQDGVPARMHYIGHSIVVKRITDKLTGLPSDKNSLVFSVDRLNGVEVLTTFSTLADTLAEQLMPYTEGRRYIGLEFIITKHGKEFQTRYSVEVKPFTG
jgi:hypothetical protein